MSSDSWSANKHRLSFHTSKIFYGIPYHSFLSQLAKSSVQNIQVAASTLLVPFTSYVLKMLRNLLVKSALVCCALLIFCVKKRYICGILQKQKTLGQKLALHNEVSCLCRINPMQATPKCYLSRVYHSQHWVEFVCTSVALKENSLPDHPSCCTFS